MGAGKRRRRVAGAGRVTARAAAGAVAAAVRAGAVDYDRARHLPRLIRAVPDDYASDDETTTRRLVKRLEKAIEAERRLGRSRHWAYDLNRHIALRQALAAETARLMKERAAR